jgi:hypothetical protein
MEQPCFQAKGLTPPLCGVHNVLLVRSKVLIDENHPYLGHIICYVCPVSLRVVADIAK